MSDDRNPTTDRRTLLEGLAMRWLVWTQNVPDRIAADILLHGDSKLAGEAFAIAGFASAVLEDHKAGRPLYGKSVSR